MRGAPVQSGSFTVFHQVVKPLGSVRGPSLLDLHLKIAFRCVKQDGVRVRAGRIHGRAVGMIQRAGMRDRCMARNGSCNQQK
jgi:hypothetical protein